MNENDKHFIKRYEELLDKGYCDCNEMNCIDNNSPRRILNIVNGLQSKIDKANEILDKWGEEPDADMYMQIKEYKEWKELKDILKENNNAKD